MSVLDVTLNVNFVKEDPPQIAPNVLQAIFLLIMFVDLMTVLQEPMQIPQKELVLLVLQLVLLVQDLSLHNAKVALMDSTYLSPILPV
jgi:hypothetical protein